MAVATGHRLATEAALTLLEAGGSAVDAAIGADAVMGFIEPTATGLGGDAMAVVATDDGVAALNGSGRSSRSLDPSTVADNGYGYVPSIGGQAVTVPGAVAAWWDLHQRFGRLAWGAIFEPAIEAAGSGGEIGKSCSRVWAAARSRLGDEAAALYFPTGKAPKPGQRWQNPLLAQTLARVAADGPGAFYAGSLAGVMAAAASAADGTLNPDDLANHASQWVEPLSVKLGHRELITMPPSCQGVVAALAAEELHRCGDLGAETSPEAIVRKVEALDRALALALAVVADPDTVAVPPLCALRDMVATAPLRGPVPYGPGTVFTAVAARDQLVALVSSVCDRFGSGVAVPSGGFVLQSRGRGFSLEPGHPNALAPSKRPYHSIVPTVVQEQGRGWLSLGVVGGIMQPQGQLQILDRLFGGADLTRAVEAPRYRLLGDGRLAAEPGFDADCLQALQSAGYQLIDPDGVDFGGAQAVMVGDETAAASDPRRDGWAAVAGAGSLSKGLPGELG